MVRGVTEPDVVREVPTRGLEVAGVAEVVLPRPGLLALLVLPCPVNAKREFGPVNVAEEPKPFSDGAFVTDVVESFRTNACGCRDGLDDIGRSGDGCRRNGDTPAASDRAGLGTRRGVLTPLLFMRGMAVTRHSCRVSTFFPRIVTTA